jgi:hypothetical protein
MPSVASSVMPSIPLSISLCIVPSIASSILVPFGVLPLIRNFVSRLVKFLLRLSQRGRFMSAELLLLPLLKGFLGALCSCLLDASNPIKVNAISLCCTDECSWSTMWSTAQHRLTTVA